MRSQPISSPATPILPLCAKYRVKVSFLVLWMLRRAAAASVLLISTRATEIPTGFILSSVVTIVIPVLFAVGFWKNMANAYNAYIRLFIAEAPLMLYVVTPLGLALVIVLVLGLEALYAYSLRNRLFPDFAQDSRTAGGKYMFSDFSERSSGSPASQKIGGTGSVSLWFATMRL
jgi:hypothetical protein